MSPKLRNQLTVFTILALPCLVLLGFLFHQLGTPPPPAKPLPYPNGYIELVKAAQLVPTNSLDYDKMSLDQLRVATAANAGALALARAGLSNECRVPIQYSQIYIEDHFTDLAGMKSLARAFVTEGKLAEVENHPDAAAKSYLDTVHLGYEATRGGVLLDGLVGIAAEAIGTSSLKNITGQLDAKSCRETAAALESLDAQGQSLDELLQQENDWSRGTFPGIRNEIMRLLSRKSMLPAKASAGRKFTEQQIRTRELMIDLAVRAYELDKGKPPTSVSDLVPDYLKAVPQDPTTGTNLVYSPR